MQGYGKKHRQESYVYPGSGATCDTAMLRGEEEEEEEEQDEVEHPNPSEPGTSSIGHSPPPVLHSPHQDLDTEAIIPEDPDLEFAVVPGEHPPPRGPRVINVGIPGPGEVRSSDS